MGRSREFGKAFNYEGLREIAQRCQRHAALPPDHPKKSPKTEILGRNPPKEEGGGDSLQCALIYAATQPLKTNWSLISDGLCCFFAL